MTDLTAARLLCEKMTRGEWYVLNNGREIDIMTKDDDEFVHLWSEPNAAGIVLAVSLLRALCDEGAVVRMARVIDPGAGWSFKYAQGEESLRALNRQRQRETVAKAQAIITSIFDAARREG